MNNKIILLVEDNPSDVELTKRALERSNIANTMIVAEDGKEALDYLFGTGKYAGRNINDFPAVVLLDLKLPKVSGLEVLQNIRANEFTKLIPIVILTSSDQEEDMITSYKLGANSYIRKPVDFNQFAEAVRTLGMYWLLLNEPPPPPPLINREVIMAIPLKVLIVEDSDSDAALDIRTLEKAGYKVTHKIVMTAKEMKAALHTQTFDLIIADHKLPQFNSLKAVAVLKESGQDIPFIVVSGIIGEEAAVKMMKAGAHDYVMKGNLSRLGAAVERELQDVEVRRERKRAEEALRQSEGRLKETQALGKIGAWEFDLSTGEIEWSDETYRLYERDKALGPPSAEEEAGYYPPEEANKLREYARIAAETGEEFNYDLTVKLSSGKTSCFNAHMHPAKDEKGHIIKLVGIVQDITERKQMEESLKQSEKRYRTLFETAAEGILLANIETEKFSYANPAICKMLGYSEKELTELGVNDIHPKDALDHIIHQFESQARGEYTLISDIPCLKKDGTIIYVDINTAPANIEGEEFNVGFFSDITERKRAEENISQSYEKLQKMLESAVEAIASIAEIRDPYTAGHQIRVTGLACAIAVDIGLSAETIADIRMGGILHDIGKMYVPAEILSKPGKLSEIEFMMIKNHPQIGYDIVKKIEFPCSVAAMILGHHERLDGSGYPHGLKGDDIPIESKILAVADVVEAMSSHRPYRAALGIDKALEEIANNRGKLYDPDVADACLKLFKEKGFKFE